MSQEIMDYVTSEVYGVWFLIGAALVFWMQAGFAMVEAGFTRAKNAGNIIMKNLMDFCIGTVMFIVIGFGLFLGEDALFGLVGIPNMDIFTNYAEFGWSNFVFNLVFCATTATIVSGAMAERTRFISYCVYSAVISGIIYPIEAHWTWGGGWLAQMGFHDFAGSNCIHMVGGICALIGAAMEGPRIGKFVKDKAGKIVKVNAFPGHNLPLGALGVFILWLGWYGFNGAAATSVDQLGSIFVTTTIAPAVATVVCMIFTWIRFGKPDVSMCLNASLAGLVAITAPCDVVDAFGATVVGAVAGVLVVFGVWFLDHKLYVDDPVGAVAVHMINGVWGTVAVGLFATDTAPTYGLADSAGNPMLGLFYGGGFKLLGIQILGMACTAAFTAVTIWITFALINMTLGLRATAEEEITGLDQAEHGLPSAYADFEIQNSYGAEYLEGMTDIELGDLDIASEESAVEVKVAPNVDEQTMQKGSAKMTKIEILCRERNLERLKNSLVSIGITGMTVSHVMGCGAQKGQPEYYRGVELEPTLLPKIRIDVVVCAVPVRKVIEVAKKTLYTGHIGDGKIFIYNVENVVKIRTGEEGFDALQDVE
ncbi:MAG: ammonium transporter [Lachnospiraceae bacterium]|nr:ammonium transporter [Lachnospiraceae bacterium]